MEYIEKKIGKHLMRIDSKQNGIHKTLRKWKSGDINAVREPELLYLIKNELKPKTTIMDLGANIGYLTLIIADYIKDDGKIYAIEPDPRNNILLEYNVKANKYKSIEIYKLAISNKNGKSKFCIANSSNLSSMTKTKATKDIIKVKTKTLTDFFNKKDFPNFIKMDVEGHECEILNGGYELFKKNDFPCKIIMEIHPKFYSEKHSLENQLKKYINELGFKTKYVISAAVEVPDLFKKLGYINPIKIFNSSGYNRGIYNNFKDDDMFKVACYEHKQYVEPRKKWSNKIVRYVMIERN